MPVIERIGLFRGWHAAPAYFLGFGTAAAIGSMTHPTGLILALLIFFGALVVEWLARIVDRYEAQKAAEAAAPKRGATFAAMDQLDLSGLDDLREMERAMDELTGRVAAVIDGYAAAYPDTITMVPLLTQVGNIVLASTGDTIQMRVTLDLDSRAAGG